MARNIFLRNKPLEEGRIHGTAAAFSFYPGKNLGACGEGGAVDNGRPRTRQKIRMLRDHGQAKKYYHDVEGYNGRLDSIQAGFLGEAAASRRMESKTEESHGRYNEMFS